MASLPKTLVSPQEYLEQERKAEAREFALPSQLTHLGNAPNLSRLGAQNDLVSPESHEANQVRAHPVLKHRDLNMVDLLVSSECVVPGMRGDGGKPLGSLGVPC